MLEKAYAALAGKIKAMATNYPRLIKKWIYLLAALLLACVLVAYDYNQPFAIGVWFEPILGCFVT